MDPSESSLNEFVPLAPLPPVAEPVSSSLGFLREMGARRTVREFATEPVPREVLLNAIATAGTAPSGANCQPWFFALIESADMKSRIRTEAERVEREFYEDKAPKGWLQDLKPLGTGPSKSYLTEAPALIAVFTRQRANAGDESVKSYYPLESTGIAVGLLITALHRAGLATLTHTPRPMQFLAEVLGLDRSHKPFMLVVTGYAKPGTRVPNIQRKDLAEICRVY